MGISAAILAGLGLFFIGVKFISDNLKKLAGRRFRRVVEASTASRYLAALIGVLAGVTTQSSSAVTFVAISMVDAGVTTIARIAPLVAWCNVGTASLVLLAAVSIHNMILFLLAVVGFAYFFDLDRSPRFRHAVGAALGVGLLFFGLEMIKEGAGPIRGVPAVDHVITFVASYDVLALLAGLAAALVVQSSSTVSVIALAMAHAGVIDLEEVVLLVFGAGLGSGASVGLVALRLSATARQLAFFQVGFKALGTGVLLAAFYLERITGWPLLLGFVDRLADTAAMQVALVFLAMQLVGGCITFPLQAPLLALCRRLSPPSPHEELARPRFIAPDALVNTQWALELAEREQLALLARLPPLMPTEGKALQSEQQAAVVIEATACVTAEIESYLGMVLESDPPQAALDLAINLRSRNDMLGGLRESVSRLLAELRGLDWAPPPRLAQSIVEATHLNLSLLVDVVEWRDHEDLLLLQTLSSDRTETMQSLRRDLLTSAQGLSHEQRDSLFAAISIFERQVWLIRRYLDLLLRPEVAHAGLRPYRGTHAAEPAQ